MGRCWFGFYFAACPDCIAGITRAGIICGRLLSIRCLTMTEGEYRVGISFNPGGNEDVDTIKSLSAELIDMVSALGNDDRTMALAQKAYEEAAMWAVKSITKPDREGE